MQKGDTTGNGNTSTLSILYQSQLHPHTAGQLSWYWFKSSLSKYVFLHGANRPDAGWILFTTFCGVVLCSNWYHLRFWRGSRNRGRKMCVYFCLSLKMCRQWADMENLYDEVPRLPLPVARMRYALCGCTFFHNSGDDRSFRWDRNDTIHQINQPCFKIIAPSPCWIFPWWSVKVTICIRYFIRCRIPSYFSGGALYSGHGSHFAFQVNLTFGAASCLPVSKRHHIGGLDHRSPAPGLQMAKFPLYLYNALFAIFF